MFHLMERSYGKCNTMEGCSDFCKRERETENVQEVVSLPADCTSDFHLEML